MKVFKKALLATVMSLSIFGPLASVPTAQAHPEAGHNHRRVYWVYYRANPHRPWVNYGGYYDQHDAHRAQRYLQHHGYDTFVR